MACRSIHQATKLPTLVDFLQDAWYADQRVKFQVRILAAKSVPNVVAQTLAALFKTLKTPNNKLDMADVSTPNMTILLFSYIL